MIALSACVAAFLTASTGYSYPGEPCENVKSTGLEVTTPKAYRKPVITDPDNPFVKSLHAAMKRKWPAKEIPITRMSCATDATRYVHLNLPTVIFGATGFGTHAKAERVSLQSLIE